MIAKTRCGVVAVGLLVLLVLLPAAGATVPRAPALGDWEGVGPHRLPLTFALGRRRGRVVLSHLVIGFPQACPNAPLPVVAAREPGAQYLGPGAPPHVLFNWRPDEIMIEVPTPAGPLPFFALDGRLISNRRAVLSVPLPTTAPGHCGWPKTLTWQLRTAHRLPVAGGGWTAAVSFPGAAHGRVTIKVASGGRVVDYFGVRIACADGGSGSLSQGPGAGDFISAAGSVRGFAWHGQFSANGVLRGSFAAPGWCGTAGGASMGTFSAHRTGR